MQLALLVLVWAIVYLPWLGQTGHGAGGLSDTEGHRAIPGWTMLESGDVLLPRMFGQAYLRKPPGMPWAVAIAGAVLGESAWSARMVSALASLAIGLAGWWYARKWFGDPGLGRSHAGSRFALAGGLATLLMPWLWSSGRSAEIEALNNAACAWAALSTLDVLLWTRRRGLAHVTGAIAIGVPTVVMLFAKGPAGLPAVAGAVAAAVLVRRSWRPVVNPSLWAGLIAGALALGVWWALAHTRLEMLGERAITQSPGSFMFESGRLTGVLVLAPTVLASALPASLALLFVWGPDARAEARLSAHAARRYRMAWGLTLTPLLAAGALMVVGVSNPRYALPAVVTLGPLVVWVLRGTWGQIGHGGFGRTRSAIGRTMAMGHPLAWAAVLIVGAWVYIWTLERADRSTSGEEAGRALARRIVAELDLKAGSDVPLRIVANDVVEARPEIVWTMREELTSVGVSTDVRWWPMLARPGRTPERGALVVARADGGSAEREWVAHNVNLGNLCMLTTEPMRVHVFDIVAGVWIGEGAELPENTEETGDRVGDPGDAAAP